MLKRTYKSGNDEAIIKATKGVGSTRISDEVSVMGTERRGRIVQAL